MKNVTIIMSDGRIYQTHGSDEVIDDLVSSLMNPDNNWVQMLDPQGVNWFNVKHVALIQTGVHQS